MTDKDIDDIGDRVCSVTPGAWKLSFMKDHYVGIVSEDESDKNETSIVIPQRSDGEGFNLNNLVFMSRSKEDIRSLLNEILRLRTILKNENRKDS